jgi:hypothetical protein
MATMTHSICDDCWVQDKPDRKAFRVPVPRDIETCCFCGVEHQSGIYIRAEPKQCLYNKFHEDEKERE